MVRMMLFPFPTSTCLTDPFSLILSRLLQWGVVLGGVVLGGPRGSCGRPQLYLHVHKQHVQSMEGRGRRSSSPEVLLQLLFDFYSTRQWQRAAASGYGGAPPPLHASVLIESLETKLLWQLERTKNLEAFSMQTSFYILLLLSQKSKNTRTGSLGPAV